jgi:hypothetical protein
VAEKIIWASDYRHSDTKFLGTTDQLCEVIGSISDEEQRAIAEDNAVT